ncbi:MAG TPA: sulfatase [Candidatus Limnocylindrales bacterium]|nr:sulfatase [Candidatus Limnocylindrales bacterium]
MIGCFRFAVAVGAAFAAACSPPPLAPFAACRDCNIVLISVDTLRADHVGAYGYSRPTTPNIDALAKKGVLFEHAVAQSSWTRPAHMSIFTGMYPREHGFVALLDSRRLEPEVPTIASVLASSGWATAGFSGGINLAASFGFGQGFDVYRNNGRSFRDNFEDMRWWLDHNDGRRFFLFAHGYDAHTPYHGDEIDRRAIGLTSPPPRGRMRRACKAGMQKMSAFVDEYDAAIRRADRYVGKIVAELERRALLSKTILILLSDHGEELLEHGRCFHISTLYREVLEVPLIVVAPGLEPRRVKEPVAASVTIAPTIMELAGIGQHPFPGSSLVPQARGAGVRAAPIVSETERAVSNGGDGHVVALSNDGYKLIEWAANSRRTAFDQSRDRLEAEPIASGSRAEVALVAELDRWSGQHPPRFGTRRKRQSLAKPSVPGGQPQQEEHGEKDGEDDPALRRREQQLKSFGYAN